MLLARSFCWGSQGSWKGIENVGKYGFEFVTHVSSIAVGERMKLNPWLSCNTTPVFLVYGLVKLKDVWGCVVLCLKDVMLKGVNHECGDWIPRRNWDGSLCVWTWCNFRVMTFCIMLFHIKWCNLKEDECSDEMPRGKWKNGELQFPHVISESWHLSHFISFQSYRCFLYEMPRGNW